MTYRLRIALIAGLMAYLTAGTAAQDGSTITKEPPEQCVLWKVTGRGIKPSYLFGTLHIIGEQDFVWTPYMQRAFDACKELMLEVDVSQMSAYAASLQRFAPMRDGSNLSDLLSEEDYQEVRTYFGQKLEYQTIFPIVQNWSPFAHITMLQGDLVGSSLVQYDAELVKKAKVMDKKIAGLSTHDTYFELLHLLPYQEQARNLSLLVKDLQNKRLCVQEISALIQAYRTQDIKTCHELIKKRGKERGDLYGFHIEICNRTWLPKIMEQSKTKKTFYAINVSHLWGAQGLVQLLCSKGYKVVPVFE